MDQARGGTFGALVGHSTCISPVHFACHFSFALTPHRQVIHQLVLCRHHELLEHEKGGCLCSFSSCASSPLSSPNPVSLVVLPDRNTTPVRLLPRQVALVVSRLVRQLPCIRFLVLVLSPAQEIVMASVVLVCDKPSFGSIFFRRPVHTKCANPPSVLFACVGPS